MDQPSYTGLFAVPFAVVKSTWKVEDDRTVSYCIKFLASHAGLVNDTWLAAPLYHSLLLLHCHSMKRIFILSPFSRRLSFTHLPCPRHSFNHLLCCSFSSFCSFLPCSFSYLFASIVRCSFCFLASFVSHALCSRFSILYSIMLAPISYVPSSPVPKYSQC